jgi:hypothetical protein
MKLMSTPKLSPHHWASCATSLAHYATEGRNIRSSHQLASELCKILEVEQFGDDDQPKMAAFVLMSDLQRINTIAHNRRYSRKAGVDYVRYGNQGVRLPLPALLKGLQCVRYNLDGGESRGALRKLDSILETITHSLVSSMPEYQKADWFIE